MSGYSPADLSSDLNVIAKTIDASARPRLDLVIGDLHKVASKLQQAGLTQPLSDRRDYGAPVVTDSVRYEEWPNTEHGSRILDMSTALLDMAETPDISDLNDLSSLILNMKTELGQLAEYLK